MVAERILPPVNPLPELEVRRVCASPVTRDAFCAIGSVCFHVPLSWFREVFDNDAVWDRFREPTWATWMASRSRPPRS